MFSTAPYRRLLALVLLLQVAVGVVLLPLSMQWWIGTVLSLLIQAAIALLMWRWLRGFVESQHEDFLKVLRELRAALPSGRESLLLKSERASDTFGSLAEQINGLIHDAQREMSQQLDRNRSLEQTRLLFESTLGNMVEGVAVLGATGNVLYFNSAARQILDLQDRDVTGRPLWELVRDPGLRSAIDTVLTGEPAVSRELEFIRTRTVVEMTAAPLELEATWGLVLVFHDVTELRRLERLRREFVSNVSHELKTPLTSIQAYADTLLEGALDDPENARLFLTRILEQSDRLQHLIQDILRLARIESQAEAFALQPVNLKTVLETCVEARRTLALSRGIDLQLAGVPAARVLADPGGLQTVIENLVSNALNHTPEKGKVTIGCLIAGDEIHIEVRDNGVGIPAEHHERIFERFYRVDKARTRAKGGTGLGLAIVKHLTSVFRGSVEVESQTGQGSLFRLIFPQLAQPEESLPSAPVESR